MSLRLDKINFDWKLAKNSCRTTVNKEFTDNEPSNEFKLDLLISEHSPIRILTLYWTWEKIKSWVATHISRHKHEKFISTQRTDRTGVNRDELRQDALVDVGNFANAQNLIDISRKRLCFQSAPETVATWSELKKSLAEVEPEMANVMVPNCVYRCGCPEPKTCGYWKKFMKKFLKYHPINNLGDIKHRYAFYNDLVMRGDITDK